MARRITHVRYGGTLKTHESITAYKWQDDGSGSIGQDSKPVMVDWVDNNRGQAYVSSGYSRATVGVIRPGSGNPYCARTPTGSGPTIYCPFPRTVARFVESTGRLTAARPVRCVGEPRLIRTFLSKSTTTGARARRLCAIDPLLLSRVTRA